MTGIQIKNWNSPFQDSSSSWLLWQDGPRSPALNMAIDETLLNQAEAIGLPLLRFYCWDSLAISIGYTQKHSLTAQPGFTLVRRPTGGGVVYHDHDFTYSAVIPGSHRIAGLNRYESYRVINSAVQAGLEKARIGAALADREITGPTDRAGMVCFEHPTRYDLLANGRKIAGSAQRRISSGILHQGSIHFGGHLPVAREHLENSLIKGFKSSLNIDFQPFTDTTALIDSALLLAAERYDHDDWNRRR